MKSACYFTGMLAAFVSVCISVSAQTRDNSELKKMYEEDQRGRSASNIDWTFLSKQDSAHRKRVYQLLDSGKVITGQDHYHTAMIFQHGMDSIAFGRAVAHMRKAIALDSTVNRWLLAAAIDRELMSRNKPQIYGTQYRKENGTPWYRYKIDSTRVSDEERRYYHVETLAEQREKERRLNLLPLIDLYNKSESPGFIPAAIRNEIAKGRASKYDASESGVNMLGYAVLAAGKTAEALAVFELNTQLYPKGYNTWDSYGECLLKLGRVQDALAAYKKSLELNPANENAKKVLSGQK